ncbi:hypothetical protein ACS0TY_035257 [Phlomoides rotata]
MTSKPLSYFTIHAPLHTGSQVFDPRCHARSLRCEKLSGHEATTSNAPYKSVLRSLWKTTVRVLFLRPRVLDHARPTSTRNVTWLILPVVI